MGHFKKQILGYYTHLAVSDGNETIVVGSISELEELTGCDDISVFIATKLIMTIPSQRVIVPSFAESKMYLTVGLRAEVCHAHSSTSTQENSAVQGEFSADFAESWIKREDGFIPSWCYPLLFDRPAFKNLICNGLVLAADGKKMSKSLKNYPDPNDVINKCGRCTRTVSHQ